MRNRGRNAGDGGLRPRDWIIIGFGNLAALVLAVVLALVISGVDQFPFSGPFRDGEALVYDGKQMRFESQLPVRCIGDLCDVVNVTEKNEDMCLVIVWTKQGKDGFLVAPRPCSTGVDIGDIGGVSPDPPEDGQCLCSDGDELVPSGPFQLLAEKGQPDGYCPLNLASLVPDIHLPPELMRIRGCWNANTNTPMLMSGGCPLGDFYVVTVAGSTMLDGTDDWIVGDGLVCVQGTFWKRVRAELELGDLVDTDTTGQMNGDVLRRIGGTWVPDDTCCVQPPSQETGFFAEHATGSQALGENTWTVVEYVLMSQFFTAGFTQNQGSTGFDNNNNVYVVPSNGWYSASASVSWHQGEANSQGKRGLRLLLNNGDVTDGVVAVRYSQNDGCSGNGPTGDNLPDIVIFDIEGVFPFCQDDILAVQAVADESDDDDDDDDLRPFEEHPMIWSMWRLPDALMPAFVATNCPGQAKKRSPHDIQRTHPGLRTDSSCPNITRSLKSDNPVSAR